MRLVIAGSMKGQLSAASKIAIDRGAAVTHTDSVERSQCCAPGVPISS
jgi:two-component system, response regulator FlrC